MLRVTTVGNLFSRFTECKCLNRNGDSEYRLVTKIVKVEVNAKLENSKLMVVVIHFRPRRRQHFCLDNRFQSLVIGSFSFSSVEFGAFQSQFITFNGRTLYKALITTTCLYCPGLVMTANSCQGQTI